MEEPFGGGVSFKALLFSWEHPKGVTPTAVYLQTHLSGITESNPRGPWAEGSGNDPEEKQRGPETRQ